MSTFGSIPGSDNRRVPDDKARPHEKLTRVSSRRLVAKIRIVSWHDDLPLQISGDCRELLKGSFQIFDDLGGDDVGIGEIGAVFEAFVFEPEPSRREASETDGQVERPTECGKRRSQHVEVSVESPASPAAALRVALR